MSDSEEVKQLRHDIRTERNALWSQAVNALFASERTSKLCLKIEEAGLIVSYRAGLNEWKTTIRSIPIEKPYRRIANHLREARGIPRVRFGENGSVEVRDGDPKHELEIAMFPIGLVVVGSSPEGVWCHEMIPVAVFTLATTLRRLGQVTESGCLAVNQTPLWISCQTSIPTKKGFSSQSEGRNN